jgi:hypothetical protein
MLPARPPTSEAAVMRTPSGWLGRATGLSVPPRSTLRRRSDRIEVGARWVVLVLGLLIVPVALSTRRRLTVRVAGR